ncbi:MAG TPA: hypothetical protein VLA72_11500 [Anaerolineales bacterium]|nr:hypothetical protein [Anaerolineales bacterium]
MEKLHKSMMIIVIEISTRTATQTPYPTITLTPTIIWISLSTLPVQEAQAGVKELLETNGGCELPCWWGIAPNYIPWFEVVHFLPPMITRVGQG